MLSYYVTIPSNPSLHLHLHQVALSGSIPIATDPATCCVGMEAVEIQGHIHVHQIAVFQGSQILGKWNNNQQQQQQQQHNLGCPPSQ